MTQQELDRIIEAARQRVGKTTPAPWVAESYSCDESYAPYVRIEMTETDTSGTLIGFTAPDVELISAAPDLQEAVLYLATPYGRVHVQELDAYVKVQSARIAALEAEVKALERPAPSVRHLPECKMI